MQIIKTLEFVKHPNFLKPKYFNYFFKLKAIFKKLENVFIYLMIYNKYRYYAKE